MSSSALRIALKSSGWRRLTPMLQWKA